MSEVYSINTRGLQKLFQETILIIILFTNRGFTQTWDPQVCLNKS